MLAFGGVAWAAPPSSPLPMEAQLLARSGWSSCQQVLGGGAAAASFSRDTSASDALSCREGDIGGGGGCET